jgi:hypothetical protein
MAELEAHNAHFFQCPRCETRTWIRLVIVPGEYAATIEPAEPWVCKQCGYRLKPLEERDAVQTGWCFTCEACGRDGYTDVTVYEDIGSEHCSFRPGSRVACLHCGAHHVIRLSDWTD